MAYLISFLEGIITFVSPCMLPLLPVYVSYFAGGTNAGGRARALKNALGFVAGFTVVFVLLGAAAGIFGSAVAGLPRRYETVVNLVGGGIVILFGLNYLGMLNVRLLNATYRKDTTVADLNFVSSVLFGIVFSIGWTPCVGAFLGSALLLAAQQGSVLQGVLMLLCYSLGLGVPLIASALLIEQLKDAFDWIKAHYRQINLFSGALLVLIGLAMMSGYMGKVLALFSTL